MQHSATNLKIFQEIQYNICKVSFQKLNWWPHWRLWGIPKGSGISHIQCIYRFICKEETVWCIMLFRFYQNAPCPTSPYLRSGHRVDVPKPPMDSSAEDPKLVLTLCRTWPQSSSAPHYKDCTIRIQNGFEGFILVQRTPQESQNTRTLGLERF